MPNAPPRLSGIVFTLALAGCSPIGIDMTNAVASSDASAARPDAPEYRKNPRPTQAYWITMKIQDAPGPFAQLLGLVQFDVVNTECLPPREFNPGGYSSPVPTEGVEIPLKKVSDTEYTGIVYADQMLDEDYYGRGVCRWKLIQAQVQMKATGADGETLFIPQIRHERLLNEQPETVYFNRRSYPRAEMDNYPNIGLTDRTRFGPSIQDSDLFTVTFTPSKEATP